MRNKITTLILVMMCSLASMAQVGIGTNSPNANAALDVVSTTKGFLPPRMTTVQRNAIASPAEGLSIYNTDSKSLQWYNGSGWCSTSDGDANLRGSGFTNGFEDNTTCTTKVISVTSCASVTGATLNDIAGTADGIEYDWTNATSYMGGTTTEALVEIGGQCWFGRNTIAKPTAPISAEPNVAPNVWINTTQPDNGYWGYYNTATTNESSGWGTTEPAVGEGLLYQWSAAMNGVSGTAAERAQGVCPTGWHVPSDCEWMYLENTLGMSTTNQQVNNNWRNIGDVGRKLSTLTLATATNSSGFTALLVGRRGTNGAFNFHGFFGNWWSSSQASATTDAQRRYLSSSQAGVDRSSFPKAGGLSVRCLKD